MQFDLTEDVQFILKKLNENGTGFLVGGAIRDFILNRESEDFDFATDIEYEKLKKIFKNYDPKEVGANFGILTINLNEKSYEIARFRKEKGTQNSRHPMEINFVESIEEDLSRRDFTINSLAYNKEKGLIDIFNGQKDIRNKIIRFIGNPKLRIEEDALRIMRAFRFMAKFGFNLDKRTAQAIYDRKKFLNRISKERIYDELSRILIAPYVKKTLKEMKRLGVLELLIPEFKYLYGTRESNLKNSKTLFINTINIVEKCEKDLVTRYVALFHNLGKINTKNINAKGEVYYYAYEKESAVITEEKLRYFHASNEMISSTKKLILYHTMVYNDISDKDLKKVIIDLNEKNLLRLFNLFEVILKVSKNSGEKLQKLKERIAKLKKNGLLLDINKLDINGIDLINLGYDFKKIGNIKNEVFDLILSDQIKNKKEDILKYLMRKYQKPKFINYEKSCGVIVYNSKSNEILLVKAINGNWGFPKGHSENNEKEIETAIRELKEETNLDVNIYSEFKEKIEYVPVENTLKQVIFFLGEIVNDDIKIEKTELEDYMWSNFEEAIKNTTYKLQKRVLEKAIKYIKSNNLLK